jgi:C4-dicarboxylate-specific signal transduction histidine kinase
MQLQLDPELPQIAAVESQIRDALVNLVFNAVDAMPQGGPLTIRTRGDGRGRNRISIEVTDAGVGMDEDTRRRCLEPFFTTKGERGTGLGLAMVFGVAERTERCSTSRASPAWAPRCGSRSRRWRRWSPRARKARPSRSARNES